MGSPRFDPQSFSHIILNLSEKYDIRHFISKKVLIKKMFATALRVDRVYFRPPKLFL